MNIYNELINKNNKALSKAITLAESTLENDQRFISNLLSKFPENQNTIRIGVTGIPGVGESSFIEKFGQTFINQGKRVAVLGAYDKELGISLRNLLIDSAQPPIMDEYIATLLGRKSI